MNPDFLLAFTILITAAACLASEVITQRRIRRARAALNSSTLQHVREVGRR